jgi:hypothetical protein
MHEIYAGWMSRRRRLVDRVLARYTRQPRAAWIGRAVHARHA